MITNRIVLIALFGSVCLRQASKPSQAVRAMIAVADERPVRWISQSELCVIPYDSQNIPGCLTRKRPDVPEQILAEARESLKRYAGASPFLACMKVSREIGSGDSVLVVVGVIGGAVSDEMSTARRTRVWFREVSGKDSMWLAPVTDTDVISSVAPITSASACK